MGKKRKTRTLEFSEAGSSHGNQSNLTEIPDHSSFYRLPDFIATKPNIALTPEREKKTLEGTNGKHSNVLRSKHQAFDCRTHLGPEFLYINLYVRMKDQVRIIM